MVTFSDNTLFLTQQAVSEGEGKQLGKFLNLSKDVKSKQIVNLILDNCDINDMAFSSILDGIIAQTEINQINGLVVK